MGRWPQYQRETFENLDTHLDNYGTPVPDGEYQVQVVNHGTRPTPGDGVWWQPVPARITGLAVGRYDAYTRWVRGDGQKVIDHVGEQGFPSFEIV
jgi:hypothetical protein